MERNEVNSKFNNGDKVYSKSADKTGEVSNFKGPDFHYYQYGNQYYVDFGSWGAWFDETDLEQPPQ